MNINFVVSNDNKRDVRDSDITYVERIFNIRLPETLREYYTAFSGCSICECEFDIDNKKYNIARFFPLMGDGLTFLKLKERFIEVDSLESNFYPIARNDGEGLFLWHALTGNIWYMAENDDSPKEYLFDSIDSLFEAMNEAVTNGEYMRSYRTNKIDFLPLGTIVCLREGRKKMMIVSRGMNVEHEGVKYFFDYCGIGYPEGAIEDQFSYFNHPQINHVIFVGYHDDEDDIVVSRLQDYVSQHPDLKRYQFE